MKKNIIIDTSDVEVSVLFLEDVDLPQLPDISAKSSRDDDVGREVSKKIETVMEILHKIRKVAIAKWVHDFERRENTKVEIMDVETLIKRATLKLSWNAVKKLAFSPEVQYIRYANENNVPLVTGGYTESDDAIKTRDLLNNMSEARALMLSDNYYSYTGGYIGDIDTGATLSHVLINGRVTWHRDCVNGTSNNCSQGNNLNPNDTESHGTAALSIVGGSNALGNSSRGVSNIGMDSFKVYNTDGAVLNAVKRAYPAAIAGNDRIILAELQYGNNHTGGGYNGEVSMLANNAFDLGYATIAAAGNYGPAVSSVAAPGNAHKALAIGAFLMMPSYSYPLLSASSRGPALDGRQKPELIAPSNTYAAYLPYGNSGLEIFPNTSGAVPYAAGAAGLARNYIRGSNTTIDPGLVYAFLINAGTNKEYAQFNNNSGAGRLRLAGPGYSWWGKVSVNQSNVSIPFTIPSTYTNLAISIWWPESPGETHKEIGFGVSSDACNPSYNLALPYIQNSVWQKHVFSKVCVGAWNLIITPKNSVNRNQDVYYSIATWNSAF